MPSISKNVFGFLVDKFPELEHALNWGNKFRHYIKVLLIKNSVLRGFYHVTNGRSRFITTNAWINWGETVWRLLHYYVTWKGYHTEVGYVKKHGKIRNAQKGHFSNRAYGINGQKIKSGTEANEEKKTPLSKNKAINHCMFYSLV